MAKKQAKTNVMRLLEQHDIAYQPIQREMIIDGYYEETVPVYKTLVTVGKTDSHYVFIVPVTQELDLKRAAEAVEEKNIHMIKEKELLPLTGYVHGGCSPIGMKHQFPTVLDESALDHETIIFSAGKVGQSVRMNPRDLNEIISVEFKPIATES